jgi:hypothetical protein
MGAKQGEDKWGEFKNRYEFSVAVKAMCSFFTGTCCLDTTFGLEVSLQ